jgi:hypothetical protein
MSTAYGGGGSGFGGFPYMGSHERGTHGGRRRQNRRKRRKPARLRCAADIVIPANNRVRLIGRGGSVIRRLRETTEAVDIFVPCQRSNHRDAREERPVRIKAESVASLLHACWKIVHLGLDVGQEVCAKVRIPSNAENLCGRVGRNAKFFWASGMEVYSIESFLDAEEVDTIVDNENFSNSSLANVQHETVYLQEEHYPICLVFVYGPRPAPMYLALQKATEQVWRKECLADLVVPKESQPPTMTVGTYNVLHSRYAAKYNEKAGISKMDHSSNWTTVRAPAIVQLLLESNLDIYLLQEVEMEGFLILAELTHVFHVISYIHPGREANDAVAILARKRRFTVEKQKMVPFTSKENLTQNYMGAATALLKDCATDKTILVASTHFYTKKSLHPEATLLEYLQTQQDVDCIIWGGDLNKEYKRSIPSGYSCVTEGHGFTRGEKKIDWIFFSSDKFQASRTEESKAFVHMTMQTLELTGYPPSDHFGEAIALSLLESA